MANSNSKTCLDIAVDHRIRLLCKPVSLLKREESSHVDSIRERGRALGRSGDEIDITAQLAGPAQKGGITVVLQQPRPNHPFSEGIDEVITDCDTLFALQDAFDLLSCSTLDIRENVKVIDLMPYVSDNVEDVTDMQLREAFHASTEAICEQEPDVLLSAGRVRLLDWNRFDDRKGDAWKLECIGVGQIFGSTAKLPVNARIRFGKHGFVSIPRVNGFHPSYAMNHNPHVSILRQLQILTIAEACGTYRGDWEEEGWMTDLRSQCQQKNQELASVSSSFPLSSQADPLPSQPQSSSRSPSRSRGSQKYYLEHYHDSFSTSLLDLWDGVLTVLGDKNLTRKSDADLYDTILRSRISQHSNDISLTAVEMQRLLEKDWPAFRQERNDSILEMAGADTYQLIVDILDASATNKGGSAFEITSILRRNALVIKQSMTMFPQNQAASYPSGQSGNTQVDLREVARGFLSLAVEVETLLLEVKTKMLAALGHEEILSNKLSKLSIAKSKW